MKTSAAYTYHLMHLADSALPVGGFAFSNGLEAAAKLGLIRHEATFIAYLEGFLDQVGSMELPFLNTCWELGFESRETLSQVLMELDATMVLPTMKRASTIQGRGLLRFLKGAYTHAAARVWEQWFRTENLPSHFLCVLGSGFKEVGFAKKELQELYIFMMLRDQISAAIRLGLVGPMQGHRVQHELLGFAEHVRKKYEARNYTEAVRACPMLDIVQGAHTHIYSKLFQN